jgi:hypothetical protein
MHMSLTRQSEMHIRPNFRDDFFPDAEVIEREIWIYGSETLPLLTLHCTWRSMKNS